MSPRQIISQEWNHFLLLELPISLFLSFPSKCTSHRKSPWSLESSGKSMIEFCLISSSDDILYPCLGSQEVQQHWQVMDKDYDSCAWDTKCSPVLCWWWDIDAVTASFTRAVGTLPEISYRVSCYDLVDNYLKRWLYDLFNPFNLLTFLNGLFFWKWLILGK